MNQDFMISEGEKMMERTLVSRYRELNQNEADMGTIAAKTPWVGFIVTGLILYFINLILHFI